MQQISCMLRLEMGPQNCWQCKLISLLSKCPCDFVFIGTQVSVTTSRKCNTNLFWVCHLIKCPDLTPCQADSHFGVHKTNILLFCHQYSRHCFHLLYPDCHQRPKRNLKLGEEEQNSCHFFKMITKVTLLQVFLVNTLAVKMRLILKFGVGIQSPNIFSFSSPIYSQKESANVFSNSFCTGCRAY